MEPGNSIDDILLYWNRFRAHSAPATSANQIWNQYNTKRWQEQKQIFAFGIAAVLLIGLSVLTINMQPKEKEAIEPTPKEYEPFNLYVYEP